MKRLLTSVLAALAIFTISEAALAGPSGGHGRDGGKHGEGNGSMKGGYGTSRTPSHEYGRDSKFWSKRFYCEEYGCYLYWCEECRWWYRYDERGERYRPLSEEYRPNHEKK
jgi:hypothetical protein